LDRDKRERRDFCWLLARLSSDRQTKDVERRLDFSSTYWLVEAERSGGAEEMRERDGTSARLLTVELSAVFGWQFPWDSSLFSCLTTMNERTNKIFAGRSF